jgi:hypothetical protein
LFKTGLADFVLRAAGDAAGAGPAIFVKGVPVRAPDTMVMIFRNFPSVNAVCAL